MTSRAVQVPAVDYNGVSVAPSVELEATVHRLDGGGQILHHCWNFATAAAAAVAKLGSTPRGSGINVGYIINFTFCINFDISSSDSALTTINKLFP